MRATRGIRSVVAGAFVVGTATVGFAVNAVAVGAGVAQPPPDGEGIRCEVPISDGDGAAPVEPILPLQNGQVGQCAQLEVTKTVTGTPVPAPPPGTTYSVVVDCVPTERDGMRGDGASAQQLPQGQTPPFTTTLTFPENGGTQSVFITGPSECTVSETAPPGCTLRSIDPATTQVEEPILYPVTVTNNCDPVVEPAVAVVQVPRFTG